MLVYTYLFRYSQADWTSVYAYYLKLFVCTRLQFVLFFVFFRRYYFSAGHVSDKNEAVDQEKELELYYMCVCVLFPRKEYAFCLIIDLYLNIL